MTTPPVVCLVTDRRRLPAGVGDETEPLLNLIAEAGQAGVDLVQIREPDLDDEALVRLARRATEVTSSTPTRILVNDRVDIALVAGAAGVHLKESSMPATRIRQITPPTWVVGRSVHAVDEGRRVAKAGGVDYLVLGTIFSSVSKPGHAGVGLDTLRELAGSVELPVLAIGGLRMEDAEEVGRTGAAGIAAIGAFVDAHRCGPGAVAVMTSKFRAEIDRGRSAPL